MKDFLFLNNENGELFFVECETLTEAWDIVWENFEEDFDIKYISEYSVEKADILGYDTY